MDFNVSEQKLKLNITKNLMLYRPPNSIARYWNLIEQSRDMTFETRTKYIIKMVILAKTKLSNEIMIKGISQNFGLCHSSISRSRNLFQSLACNIDLQQLFLQQVPCNRIESHKLVALSNKNSGSVSQQAPCIDCNMIAVIHVSPE